jgi:RimJ/RimL family protein N-acetyltransferase
MPRSAVPPSTFETDRLVVRLYSQHDAAFVVDMYGRREVLQFLGTSATVLRSLKQASAAIDRWRAVSDPNPLLGFWAVTLKTGEPVGTVLLKRAPLSASERPLALSSDLEVGWHLHPDQWGRGFATEAAAGALRRAFDSGVDEVIAIILPANERSKLVAGRLGMRYAGMTDRYYSLNAEIYRANRRDSP